MKIDILTLFPDTVSAVLHESILGRASAKGLIDIRCHQIRDYTENKQNQVDDYPYGGGWGCIMQAQPLKSCLDHVLQETPDKRTRVIYLSAAGSSYTEETARRLVRDYDHLVLICGHYEGVDQRFLDRCVDEEICIGDYVLTGGEIAAMAVADSVCRLVPGVLSDEQCYIGESHWDGLLEYPQYTRPENWEGMTVPTVLLEGNQAKIDRWRYQQQLLRTKERRPDLFAEKELSESDRKLVERHLEGEILCRKAEQADLAEILSIARHAKALMKSRRIDQWQGAYPTEQDFAGDISRGECYVITVNGKVGAVFTLTEEPQACYDAITDGKWSSDDVYISAHRGAVEKEFLGTGLSDVMMRCIENEARARNISYIRADTHPKNKSMQRCLKDAGYRYRGNVLIDSEPGHDPRRYAFEKRIKKH